jgi:Phage major capsid protein E
VFEEYRGRVGTVDFTDASKAYFFPVGVPGLFRQYNAPADFVETANTIGLPRYAKQAVDQQFARWVMLHVQSNPLSICTRPGGADQGQAHLMVFEGAVDAADAHRHAHQRPRRDKAGLTSQPWGAGWLLPGTADPRARAAAHHALDRR